MWQSLRQSPDRVIVGEVRGPEVIPLTNAMSMGNDGSMRTLHSSCSQGAFTKPAANAVQGPERTRLAEAADYLAVAPTVVGVVRDAPVTMSRSDIVPPAPADPDRLAELGERWNLGGSLERLVKASADLAAPYQRSNSAARRPRVAAIVR